MAILRSKTKTIATSLFLMLAMAATLIAVPLANAHDPPWTIPTYAYIVVSPNPVGVGQSVFVVMWINRVPPSAGGIGGDRWTGYTVKITRPDNSIENLGPFISDPTSSAYYTYTPNQVGTYKFEFNFPGQVASLYHPETGIPGGASDFINDTHLASSATTTLTVQEEAVQEPPTYPLPTQYWTRPIEGQNTAWFTVASNYLNPFGAAYMYGSERFQPDGIAPNSPHIMWTKPLDDGGVVGGSYEFAEGMTYYTGLSYESRFSNPLIIYGRLYYDAPLSDDANDGPYMCVDLRTGETLWENIDISPSFGQLYMYDSMNQHGVIGDGYLWQTSGFATQRWEAYDPRTGEWLFTLTDVPSGTTVYGPNGEITRYVLDSTNKWLALWNNSAAPDGPLVRTPGTGTNAYQYRPIGKTADMSTAYTWNVTIPASIPAGSSILKAIPNDLLLGSTPTQVGGFSAIGTNDYTVWAISLKSGSIGSLLWMKNYQGPSGNLTRQFGPVDPVNRVFTMNDKETMQWVGYNLDGGELLWGPVGEPRDFNYYPTIGMGGSGQAGFTAYGNLYVGGYGGEYFCYSMKNGTLLWKYSNTFSAHETPWGNYPIFPAAIVDGKIYLYSGEHSPNAPPYKGSRVRCVNATTGEEIWTMLGWGTVGGFSDQGWPVADGCLVYLNAYDMQIYCIGKGPSATTVAIQDDVITHGDSVLVKGTVTDISAGAKRKVDSGEFNMVPAVSDESMGPWMEYIYMQKPWPADVTGVEVSIEVRDPNNNYYEVGRTTSDASGMYKLMFTPEVPGEYTVIARFAGSESYWPSYAQTAIGVLEAPQPTPPPTPTPAPMTDTYVLGIGAGAIVAIVVIGLVLVLMLRKR